MERLKKYNQIIFAIISTAALGMFLFAVIMSWFESADRPERRDNSMVSEEKAKEFAKDNKRIQLIDFSDIELIDPVTQTFLIPVSQKQLLEWETIRKQKEDGSAVSFMLEARPVTITKGEPAYYRFSPNLYNNILIYRGSDHNSSMVFDYRICIVDYNVVRVAKGYGIVIIGSTKDTNHDDKMNSKDLLDAYYYDISTSKLHTITTGEHILSMVGERRYRQVKDLNESGTDRIFFQVGIDKDNDGLYIPNYEPSIFTEFNITNKNYRRVVDQQDYDRLQSRLDGLDE